jgi:hypothetical protein
MPKASDLIMLAKRAQAGEEQARHSRRDDDDTYLYWLRTARERNAANAMATGIDERYRRAVRWVPLKNGGMEPYSVAQLAREIDLHRRMKAEGNKQWEQRFLDIAA